MLNALNSSSGSARNAINHEASILKEAIRVFGAEDIAVRWLNTPSKALNGKIPKELIKTAEGREKVNGRLVSIQEGMYS